MGSALFPFESWGHTAPKYGFQHCTGCPCAKRVLAAVASDVFFRPAALAGSASDMFFILLLLERSMPEMYINIAYPSHAVCLPNFLSRTVRVSPRRIVWAGSAAAVRSSNLYAYSIAVLHGKCLQSVLLKSALLLVECHASAFCF